MVVKRARVGGTDSSAVAGSDGRLRREQEASARLEAAVVCPEGAGVLAAAHALRASGWVAAGERGVALNTGAGIKYPDTVSADVPVLKPEDSLTR